MATPELCGVLSGDLQGTQASLNRLDAEVLSTLRAIVAIDPDTRSSPHHVVEQVAEVVAAYFAAGKRTHEDAVAAIGAVLCAEQLQTQDADEEKPRKRLRGPSDSPHEDDQPDPPAGDGETDSQASTLN
jgi:hypothetical protein